MEVSSRNAQWYNSVTIGARVSALILIDPSTVAKVGVMCLLVHFLELEDFLHVETHTKGLGRPSSRSL